MEAIGDYWSWWKGALALAGVGLGYWLVNKAPLGVSGHWERLLDMRRQRTLDKAAAGLACAPEAPRRVTWTSSLFFIGGILSGGLLSRLGHGGFGLQTTMGADFTRLFGDGWGSWLVLFIGGALVGYGTRMADGCTSGHGLIGVSRFQKGSLASTAVFFGTAIAVSWLSAGLR